MTENEEYKRVKSAADIGQNVIKCNIHEWGDSREAIGAPNRVIKMAKKGNQQQIRAAITMARVLAALISRVLEKRLQAASPWIRQGCSDSVLRFVDFQCCQEMEKT